MNVHRTALRVVLLKVFRNGKMSISFKHHSKCHIFISFARWQGRIQLIVCVFYLVVRLVVVLFPILLASSYALQPIPFPLQNLSSLLILFLYLESNGVELIGIVQVEPIFMMQNWRNALWILQTMDTTLYTFIMLFFLVVHIYCAVQTSLSHNGDCHWCMCLFGWCLQCKHAMFNAQRVASNAIEKQSNQIVPSLNANLCDFEFRNLLVFCVWLYLFKRWTQLQHFNRNIVFNVYVSHETDAFILSETETKEFFPHWSFIK